MSETHKSIEPRVAKLEGTLEALTSDVRDLAGIVRDQGKQMQVGMERLGLSVERASAPKSVQWFPLIGTVLSVGALIVSIGAAVLSPMIQRIGVIESAVMKHDDEFHGHEKLTLHPVGAQRIDALEKTVEDLRKDGTPKMRETVAVLEERLKALEKKP